MITGSNTNIRHRGRLFHVQTEDSGREHPHVISHLYYQGTILGSQKTTYADLMASDNLDGEVRALMERQHEAMVTRLKGGGFDAVIAERLGDGAAAGGDRALGPATSAREPDRQPTSFGAQIGSQKPLDQVILDYLVKKARKRSESSPSRAQKKR